MCRLVLGWQQWVKTHTARAWCVCWKGHYLSQGQCIITTRLAAPASAAGLGRQQQQHMQSHTRQQYMLLPCHGGTMHRQLNTAPAAVISSSNSARGRNHTNGNRTRPLRGRSPIGSSHGGNRDVDMWHMSSSEGGATYCTGLLTSINQAGVGCSWNQTGYW
jgi:hypothetical protein